MLRRRLILFIGRGLVILLAAITYLVLLPVRIESTDSGLQVSFPTLFRAAGRAGGDPVNWNYLLLLPISFLILAVGLEIIHLFEKRKFR